MSLLRSGDAGAGALEVEDELAGVGLILVAEGECDKRGDVSATVVGAAGDETAGSVEVDSASLAVVLRGEVGEDGCDGLSVGDDRWAAVGGGSRDGRSSGGSGGVGICGIGVAA